MSFVEEAKTAFKAPQTMPPTGPSAAPAEDATTAPDAAPADPTAFFNTALPVGAAPLDPAAKAAEEARLAAMPKAPAPERPSAPIRIADKEFNTIEEAIKYAAELEVANREDKAYREGVEAAATANKQAVNTQPEKTFIDEAEAMMFEDPKKAIALIVEGTEKRIFDTYNKMTTEQQKTVVAEKARSDMWNNFYSQNADLVEAREYVDFMLEKNKTELYKKPVPDALAELAALARKGLKINRDANLPSRELQSQQVQIPGASANATSTQASPTEEKSEDFITQMSKIRKRK